MPVRYPPANEKLAVLHISSSNFNFSWGSQMQNQAIWKKKTQKTWAVGIIAAFKP